MAGNSSAKFQKVNSGAMGFLAKLRDKLLKPSKKAGASAANKLINMHKR